MAAASRCLEGKASPWLQGARFPLSAANRRHCCHLSRWGAACSTLRHLNALNAGCLQHCRALSMLHVLPYHAPSGRPELKSSRRSYPSWQKRPARHGRRTWTLAGNACAAACVGMPVRRRAPRRRRPQTEGCRLRHLIPSPVLRCETPPVWPAQSLRPCLRLRRLLCSSSAVSTLRSHPAHRPARTPPPPCECWRAWHGSP
mmetsp:Transcript_32251/g.96291  ORF Transcript_32251/g.96291 Transcript_32251/m.96291 type:complete len:201 (-) Transcript_32251:283-885(-)